MKLFFDDAALAHKPSQFMVAGRTVPPVETPDRALALAGALEAIGLMRVKPADRGLDPIHAVHAEHYTAFLREAYARFMELPEHGPEVWPNAHPYLSAGLDLAQRPPPRATGIIGRAGWYVGDMACAIMAGTWTAAYASAQAAIAGADALLAGEQAAYALCRPPGHHAYADRASGFCFLNNAAIAAERLRTHFARVAIVDFDTHHGDGTQAVFYRRNDVLVCSSHTDPSNYYPHFIGYDDERGTGLGEGYNVNLPLQSGAGDEVFIEANRTMAAAVRAFTPDALIVSAGWDAHKSDPLSKLTVTTDGFARVGEIMGGLRLPTLIVQEGGYSLAAVQETAPRFVTAFRGSAAV
jgi:acetoin utilization deacetylase AcuC-like enzyme